MKKKCSDDKAFAAFPKNGREKNDEQQTRLLQNCLEKHQLSLFSEHFLWVLLKKRKQIAQTLLRAKQRHNGPKDTQNN